ncbi:hypothetical protein D3C71_1027010 [compost metagenome]
MCEFGVAIEHQPARAQIERAFALAGGTLGLLMAQPEAGGQFRQRRWGVAGRAEHAVVLAIRALQRGEVIAAQAAQGRADQRAQDGVLMVPVGGNAGDVGERLIAGGTEAQFAIPAVLLVVDAAGQRGCGGHVEVVAGGGVFLLAVGQCRVQGAAGQLPLRAGPGHGFILGRALGRIVDVSEVTGTTAAVVEIAVGAVIQADIQRQIFVFEHPGCTRAQVIGDRIDGERIGRLPAQLALQIGFLDLALDTVEGREVLEVAVFVRGHERDRAEQPVAVAQRTAEETIHAAAVAVAERGDADIDLALGRCRRCTRAHQYQAGFAVGPVQRPLRPAQDLHRLHMVQHRVAQLAERNAIDIDRGPVDQKRVGLDTADGDEHVAELAHHVELHVGGQLVQVAELGDVRFFERFAVEHGDRHVALEVRGIAFAAGHYDAVQLGGLGGRGGLGPGGCTGQQRKRGEHGAGKYSVFHERPLGWWRAPR